MLLNICSNEFGIKWDLRLPHIFVRLNFETLYDSVVNDFLVVNK